MAIRSRVVATALFCLSAGSAWSQTIVQPGAPGESGKTFTPETVPTTPRGPVKADVDFMQGMIMHHNQAVEMTALMAARSHNKDLLAFGKRISISQSDEMKYMKQWLEDRGKATTMEMDHSKMDHSKMDRSKMGAMPPMMMPGMLTPEQMTALAQATGPKFDHLFLTGMMQHHGGALTMVKELLDTPDAGQDPQLFDFITDVDNTQSAEIKIMQGMLNKEKK
jgi:uncharacterized protein (DUF305 family)